MPFFLSFWGIIILIVFIALIAAPFICAYQAKQKGHSPILWFFCGLFLSWLAVIIILVIQPNPSGSTANLPKQENPKIFPAKQFHQQKYAKYTCISCGETIDTLQCSYCGHVHNAEYLKKIPKKTIPDIDKNFWLCDCGCKNPKSANECSACFKSKGR